jgi:hypothetical protein
VVYGRSEVLLKVLFDYGDPVHWEDRNYKGPRYDRVVIDVIQGRDITYHARVSKIAVVPE